MKINTLKNYKMSILAAVAVMGLAMTPIFSTNAIALADYAIIESVYDKCLREGSGLEPGESTSWQSGNGGTVKVTCQAPKKKESKKN